MLPLREAARHSICESTSPISRYHITIYFHRGDSTRNIRASRNGFVRLFHTEDVEMRSAERRALIVLGLTAIIASIFAAMLGTIWVGKANETSFVLNVPQNSPIPHATYYP